MTDDDTPECMFPVDGKGHRCTRANGHTGLHTFDPTPVDSLACCDEARECDALRFDDSGPEILYTLDTSDGEDAWTAIAYCPFCGCPSGTPSE